MRGAESAPILFFIDPAHTGLVTYRIGARRLLSLLNQPQLIPSINQALVIAGSARDPSKVDLTVRQHPRYGTGQFP